MSRTLSRSSRWLLRFVASCGLVLFTGCANELSDPARDGEVSTAAREAAVENTHAVLQSGAQLSNARLVEDLTGGFAVGLASEATGLGMELGEDFTPPMQDLSALGAGATFVRARITNDEATHALRAHEAPHGRALHRAPGDLILTFTVDNFDGSVSVIRIYEGETASIVRVQRSTTWPNGNVLLLAIEDEILVDLGADREDAADDVWLYLRSELQFRGGAALAREIDLRETGGLRDDARVTIVSTYTPRPEHPRLVDVVTSLVVDLHDLEVETDDRFVSVERVTRFTGTAADGDRPRVEESLVLEQPVAEGEEPCGGTLERDVHFRNDRELRRWTDTASFACAGGGRLSRTIVYADGSSDAVVIEQGSDGIVHLDGTSRDGTTVSGSFDEAAGTFEITTVHPQGHDPARRAVQGSVDAANAAWELSEQVTYLDGFVERNELAGSQGPDGRTLSGSHEGRDESVEFELSSNLDETRLEGFVQNDRGQRVEFEVEQFADGGSIIDFVATEPGLRIVGHLEVQADGCGTGTLTITENGSTVTIDISFCGNALDDVDAILAGAR